VRRGRRTGLGGVVGQAQLADVAVERDVRRAVGADLQALLAELLAQALELLGVDEDGLDRADREYLRAIAERFNGGPVGLSTIAVAIGEDEGTLEEVYEPYLIQQGLIQRTPRGRVLTARGRELTGMPNEPGMPSLLD
jgi:Holliday junction DNA helicase RuvB